MRIPLAGRCRSMRSHSACPGHERLPCINKPRATYISHWSISIFSKYNLWKLWTNDMPNAKHKQPNTLYLIFSPNKHLSFLYVVTITRSMTWWEMEVQGLRERYGHFITYRLFTNIVEYSASNLSIAKNLKLPNVYKMKDTAQLQRE